MKTRNTIILFFCIILAAFTLGSAGLINVMDESMQAVSGSDCLIGVLITKKPLFMDDMDMLFSGNINMSWSGESTGEDERAGKQGRIYARTVVTSQTEDGETYTETDYVFDNIDGIRFFRTYDTEVIDEEIADVKECFNMGHPEDDSDDTASLEGTVYYVSHHGPLYVNGVYQTPEGDVYAVSGQEEEFIEQNSHSLTLTESETVTSNGRESFSASEVTVNFCPMKKPAGTVLLQFNKKNKLLEKTDLNPGDQQDHIDALPGAQYMIVEMRSGDGISRTLFQREDDSLYAFSCRYDGICIKHDYDIHWSD